MNVFYNYNLAPMCAAVNALQTDGQTCKDAKLECIQQNLFAFMSSANIIYFWLHFDGSARNLIYGECSKIEGFNVPVEVFDQVFDFNPGALVNMTAPANVTAPATAPVDISNATAPGEAANATAPA